MRLSVQFSMVLLPFIIMATNIAPVHCQMMKSITQQFQELAAATHKLSQWNPNGFGNPEADATALGKKLDETTKAMQQHGPLKESDAQGVSTSLGQMSNDIKTLGANVKSGATLFAISGQTKKVVGGMQTYGNNFATLFSITENDMPSDQLSMVRGYDATSICAIDDAIKSLDSSACQPQGQAYCDALNNKQPQAIDLSKNCPNPQVNAANFMNLNM